jgi:hypothetical protein
MQANPRARVAANWSPPPDVSAPVRSTPAPVAGPSASQSHEAEFENTLGSLVDYYASLPPAEYGEPPVVSSSSDVTEHTDLSRSYFWWGLCSLIMGAALAAGALAIVHMTRHRPGALGNRREVPISVKIESRTAAAPTSELATEPLDETVTPETSALPDETAAAVEFAKPAPSVATKVAPASTKPPRTAAASKRSARRTAHVKRAADEESWEDPYR